MIEEQPEKQFDETNGRLLERGRSAENSRTVVAELEDERKKQIVDILMNEYAQRRREIMAHKERYDRQERILYAYVAWQPR